MKLTNRFNLPEPFVLAVSADDYARGDADFTATELVRPVRIDCLTKAHWDEMVEDASDRVWALQGAVKHTVLERVARQNPNRYIVEHRFKATLPGGLTVSGQIDLFDMKDGTLYDWKETSVWKFMIGDTREWEEQANINLFLMRSNDMVVHKLVNIAILKDWKARKARTTKDGDYPQCAIHVLDLPMWSVGQAQAFILERMMSHTHGREEVKAGHEPELCTKKERWQKDKVYAVKRKGRKRAIRLIDSADQAYAMLRHYEKRANPGEKFEIEERQSEPVRCLDFCPVWKWCEFGKKAHEKFEQQNLL